MLFGNQSCEASLAKELVNFLIPSFGRGGDYFHSVDSVQEPDWDSSVKVVNYCGSVGGGVEFCFHDFEFEFSHVLWEVIIVADMGVGEPGGDATGYR